MKTTKTSSRFHPSAIPVSVFVLVLALGAEYARAQDPAETPSDSLSSPESHFEETSAPDVENPVQWQPAEEPEADLPDSEAPSAPKPPSRADEEKLVRVAESMKNTRSEQQEDEAARRSPGSGGGFYLFLKTAAALLFVLALIVFLFTGLRAIGQRSPLLGGLHLGQVVGRIGLTPRASLHFVRAGGRVLVVGVSPNQVSLVAEFDATAFDGLAPDALRLPIGSVKAPKGVRSFISHFMGSPAEPRPQPSQVIADDDIASLRGDIQRLEEYLRENTRSDSS